MPSALGKRDGSWPFGICLLVLGLTLAGCSRRDEPGKPVVPPPTSRPAEGESAPPRQDAARTPRRYGPVPAELLAPIEPGPRTALSLLDSLEQAVSAGNLEMALAGYGELRREFPQAAAPALRAATQLARALLTVTPPRAVDAARVLKDTADAAKAADAPRTLREQWACWSLAVHLGNAQAALLGDEASYQGWRHTFNDLLGQCAGRIADARPFIGALDDLVRSVGPERAEAAARLDAVMIELQLGLDTARMLAPVQQRRVQLLINGKRHQEALYETRVLLAVASSSNEVAWFQAVDHAVQVVQAAGKDEATHKALPRFQYHGPEGEDGRAGTGDDIANPLADATRANPDLAARLETRPDPQAARVPERLAHGYGLILAVRAGEAAEWLAGLTTSDAIRTPAERRAVLEAMCMASAYLDGHAINCHARVAALASEGTALWNAATPAWRYSARRLIDDRLTLAKRLTDQDRPQVALGILRHLADQCADTAQGERALNAALTAVDRVGGDDSAEGRLSRYQVFGDSLTNPRARICRARIAAEHFAAAGYPALGLAEIDRLKASPEVLQDEPELALLYASLLVRADRADQALPILEGLSDSLAASQDTAARAKLLLGAVHLQQGHVAEAREVLGLLLHETPEGKYADRARQILDRI